VPQRLSLLKHAMLLLHQFEELGWPSGFPSMMNKVYKQDRDCNE
jgi:hypothetical protein